MKTTLTFRKLVVYSVFVMLGVLMFHGTAEAAEGTEVIVDPSGLTTSSATADEIKNMCNYKLSFSKLTYPHGLFRLILLEQIYRSFKIINNETYHK